MYQWSATAWLPFLVPGNSSQKTKKKYFSVDGLRQPGKGKTYSSLWVGPYSPSQEIPRQKLTKLCPCQHTGAIFWNYFPAGRSLLLATLAVNRSDQRGGGTNAGSEYHNDSTHILLPKELPVKYWKYRNNNNLDSLRAAFSLDASLQQGQVWL